MRPAALLRALPLVVLAALAAGCGPGPTEVGPRDGLRGAIARDPFLSRFDVAIRQAQMTADLDAEGLTVFAPTDVAFRYFGADALRRLENNPSLFASVLRRHVVRGRVDPAALVDGAELPTLAGPPLVVRRDEGRVTVGGLPVALDPFDAGNGLLYEVGGFYTDHLSARARLELIPMADRARDLLQRSGVLGALDGPQPVTAFLPINEAFIRLTATQLDRLLAPENADILNRLGRLHVAPGRYVLDAADGALEVPTLDGHVFTLAAEDGALTIDGAPVFTQPIETATGVLYLVGDVLAGGLTLEQRLRGYSALRLFGELLREQPEAAARLLGGQPYTLFAPTNAALTATGLNVLEALVRPPNAELFRRFVDVHFVEGVVPSDAMTNGTALTSVEGRTLSVSRDPLTFRINGRNVAQRDLRARNGVIHALEGELRPVVDAFDAAILFGMPAFTEAVRAAGLEALVRRPEPISVIAFSDGAAASVSNLLSRPDLPRIIRFHLVDGVLSPFEGAPTFTPMEGPPRTVGGSPQTGFTLDGAPNFRGLTDATNGRVFGVDGLVIPPQ